MDSGIYRLTFENGSTYIGKSLHLARRQKQHRDKLASGTASENMLKAYHQSGRQFPHVDILVYCHPDLLDPYENVFVNLYDPPLNTQRPVPRPPLEVEVLLRHAQEGRALYSVPVALLTLEMVHQEKVRLLERVLGLLELLDQAERRRDELDQECDTKAMQELRKNRKFVEMEELVETLGNRVGELESWQFRVKRCNWWQRLWRLW